MPEDDPFRPPSDAEIAMAEQRLNVTFHPDYRAFLQGGGDVANACFEAAVILPNSGHLDIFEIAETAWGQMGVPRDLLPIVEDNGDYYCVNSQGGSLLESQRLHRRAMAHHSGMAPAGLHGPPVRTGSCRPRNKS